MSIETVNIGDTGQQLVNKLASNFTELYSKEETDPIYLADKPNIALKTELESLATNVSNILDDAVSDSDPRLSDARTPLEHTHDPIDINVGLIEAGTNIEVTRNAATGVYTIDSTVTSGEGGTTNHAELDNLGYDNSGHTGFASSDELGELVTGLNTAFQGIQEQFDDTMQLPEGTASQIINGVGNVTDLKTINGESLLGTGNIEIPQGITNHDELDNLDFGNSGHTGFASTQNLSNHTNDTDIHITIGERESLIRNKGFFLTSGALISAHPTPTNGDFAIVGDDLPSVWAAYNGVWGDTDTAGTVTQADLQGEIANREALEDNFTIHAENEEIHITDIERGQWDNKQDELISGTNIKTINGNSLLGSGDITIEGGSDSIMKIKLKTGNISAIEETKTEIPIPTNAINILIVKFRNTDNQFPFTVSFYEDNTYLQNIYRSLTTDNVYDILSVPFINAHGENKVYIKIECGEPMNIEYELRFNEIVAEEV